MRKYVKAQCFKKLSSLEEMHGRMAKSAARKHMDEVTLFLEGCQQTAIGIGTTIEASEGEGTEAVRLLEDYCEIVYQANEDIEQNGNFNERHFEKRVRRCLSRVKTEIREVISTQYEFVFLPYKASMWDSLESVWKASDEDPDCDAYVIPIPYYDKNRDGSRLKLHYEGDQFPESVPITKYSDYDFAGRHPDAIFIHNPYDKTNLITEIHKDFFTDKLRNYTDELVFIPYAVSSKDQVAEQFAYLPGTINTDTVVVQSEKIRDGYIEWFRKAGAAKKLYNDRTSTENRFVALGSPKFDKALGVKREDYSYPEEWLNLVTGQGKRKPVLFFNTSLNQMLYWNEKYMLALKNILEYFKEHSEILLLWRPHPLMMQTIKEMRPSLLERMTEMVENYKNEGWGIWDESSEFYRAVAFSDAYYGDWSSVATLFQCRKQLVVLFNKEPEKVNQNAASLEAYVEEPVLSAASSKESLEDIFYGLRSYLWEGNLFPRDFMIRMLTTEDEREKRALARVARMQIDFLHQRDGTPQIGWEKADGKTGERILAYLKKKS